MVTVAIPTLNGGSLLERVLVAAKAQRLPNAETIELLVCDSGSSDGSVALARQLGAEVIAIPRGTFSHGGTRNLLMDRAMGDRVAFLTQDAVPADDGWLEALLGGFDLAADVALVYGPYRPRADASVMVARELTEWFAGFAPDGRPRIDRLSAMERPLPPRSFMGPRAFFTDANGCVAKAAWQEIPFRPVAYAEDHVLALDLLRAGYAKVFMPQAAVVHSHEYTYWNWLRRAFDEARALERVYGWRPSGSWREFSRTVRGRVGADWRWAESTGRSRSAALLWASTAHHTVRAMGTLLGSRAEKLPPALTARLSLEGRAE